MALSTVRAMRRIRCRKAINSADSVLGRILARAPASSSKSITQSGS